MRNRRADVETLGNGRDRVRVANAREKERETTVIPAPLFHGPLLSGIGQISVENSL